MDFACGWVIRSLNLTWAKTTADVDLKLLLWSRQVCEKISLRSVKAENGHFGLRMYKAKDI